MRTITVLLVALLLTGVAQAKQGRSYYTDALVAEALAKTRQLEWARGSVVGAEAGAARWIAMSDQELWDFVPPPDQLRALNVCFGVDCPVHGAEIFRKGGHYPWIMSDDRPFKVRCPVGNEEYPGNDFKPWNTDSLKEEPQKGPGYVDNGAGCLDERGQRFYFVGYYVFWHRWQRQVLPAIPQLAQAYLLTGKPIYAHKCAVLLTRIAADYERFDYPTQAYHNGSWPARINGRILDYIWSTGVTSSLSLAYDAIYPGLDDPELLSFLKTHQVEQPRQFIEQKMLKTMATDIMRGFVKGNEGMHQQALATVAIVWDNNDPAQGPTTRQMADWLMTGPGDSEFLLWNGFYRDGHGGESSPGYSSGWVSNYYQVARLLPLIGVDIWSSPKLKKMADIGLDLTVAGIQAPSIGDSGSINGGGKVGWSAAIQGPAFAHTGDVRFAQALKQMGAQADSLWDTQFDAARVEETVARAGKEIAFNTRNLGGYGLAILEAGEGHDRRGVSMYYGHAGGGHGHRDRLTLEMLDSRFKAPVLNDMGYPAHWLEKNNYWTSNTVSHYAVLVNENGQQTMYPGALNTLASAPGVQFMDAAAERVAYPRLTSLYRRSVALIDLSPTSSYVVDLYRVKGGWQHDYSFHGPAFPEFTVSGGEPGPVQAEGTLAGPEVKFGGKPTSQASPAGQALVLRSGEGVIDDARSYGDRSLEGWSSYYSGPETLCRKPGAVMSVKAAVPAGKIKLFLRAYDYNSGTNVVEVRIGDQTREIKWEPSGTVGYRWLSEVFDLPQAADKITLTARAVGQSYILLESMAFGTDLQAEEPRVWDPSGSGFQYLYNIRRLKPRDSWSATWRDPAADLALTLTMPRGCTQEVILADAEPELQPGAPKSLQYLLARNLAGPQDKQLSSTYVGVAEPHRGQAQISAVNRLEGQGAIENAVGLEVAFAGGRDLIHSNLTPGDAIRWSVAGKTLTAAAEFAVLRLDDRGVRSATLVNGTELSYGDFALKAAASPAGKVLAVDHKHNTITLDAPLSAPAACADRVVILGNEKHQTSYTIKAAKLEGGATVLDLGDTLCLVGMGRITAVDTKASTVTTDTTLTGYGRVDGGQHAGRWLYNEDKSRGFRIASFGGDVFKLEGVEGDLNAIFSDADKDGLRRLWISDIGPGDTFHIPAVTFVQRTRPGLYQVRMMTPCELSVPVK